MSACTRCGYQSRPGAAFCGECGAALAADGTAKPRADNPPGYITLPPGVTPVAATNTGPAPSPSARAAAQPPPAPPIAPYASPAPPAAPPAPPAAPPAPPAEALDVDATRAAAPRRTPQWSLVLPDGSSQPIHTSAVIGRAPDATAHGVDQTVSVGPDQKSVSKSHALVEVTPTGLRVRDLGSVNGVAVVHADGRESEATESTFVDLVAGDELELGEFVLVVSAG
ncbi:MAG: FHA domain-containing protein [Microcella pacifica]